MALAVLVQALGNVTGMQKGGLEQHWVYFCPAVPSMGCVPQPRMLYKKPRKAFGGLLAVLTS